MAADKCAAEASRGNAFQKRVGDMGIFTSQEERHRKEAERTEFLQRRAALVQNFQNRLASLEPVFAKSRNLEFGQMLFKDFDSYKDVLLFDLASMVNVLARSVGDPELHGKAAVAAGTAFAILQRCAPEVLPTPEDMLPNLPAGLETEDGAYVMSFSVLCNRMREHSEFRPPVLLSLLEMYDTEYGGASTVTLAGLFREYIAFLESATALRGQDITRRYIATFDEIIAEHHRAQEDRQASTSATPSSQSLYEVLGVAPGCTDEELKRAYHAKVGRWHPDKFHTADLPSEMKDFATRELARINDAYQQIREQRAASRPESRRPATPPPQNAASARPATGPAAPARATTPGSVSASRTSEQAQHASSSGGSGRSDVPFSAPPPDGNPVWRYAKVGLRSVWRLTKILWVMLFSIAVAALVMLSLLMFLKEHWDNEVSRQKGYLPRRSRADAFMDYMSEITYLPRMVWNGLVTIISILFIAIVIAGQSLWNLAVGNAVLTISLLALGFLALVAWVCYEEWQAEFDASLRKNPTTFSWVMGLVVLLLVVGGSIMVLPVVSPDLTAFFQSQTPTHTAAASHTAIPTAASRPVAPVAAPAVVDSVPSPFDPKQALELLYGPYDEATGAANWTSVHPPDNQQFSGFRNTATALVRVAFQEQFTESGVEKIALLTYAVPAGVTDYECHACVPMLGAATFAQDGSRWKLEASERYLAMGDGFGKPSEAQIVQIGPDRFGLRINPRYGAMGEEGASQIFFAAIGNRMTPVFKQLILDDNCAAGLPECSHAESAVSFVPGANPSYYDIKVVSSKSHTTASGTEKTGPETKLYSFESDKYVEFPSAEQAEAPAAGEPTSTSALAPADARAIQALLNNWADSFRQRDLPRQVGCYASELDTYFRKHNVSREFVANDKARAFANIAAIRAFELRDVGVESTSDTSATVKFRKHWDTSLASGKSFSGEEIEELQLAKQDGAWLIQSEKELQILDVSRDAHPTPANQAANTVQ